MLYIANKIVFSLTSAVGTVVCNCKKQFKKEITSEDNGNKIKDQWGRKKGKTDNNRTIDNTDK